MSENPWFLINRGTQAKGWRGSGKWNQEKDSISHFCCPLSYSRIWCNESLRHSTDTFKWWRKFIVRWRAPDRNLPPHFVRSLWSEKEIQTAQQVCFLQAWWNLQMTQLWKNVFVLFYPKNVYGEGCVREQRGVRPRETEEEMFSCCCWKCVFLQNWGRKTGPAAGKPVAVHAADWCFPWKSISSTKKALCIMPSLWSESRNLRIKVTRLFWVPQFLGSLRSPQSCFHLKSRPHT